MAATNIVICNSALDKLGATRITALDSSSVESRLCTAHYAVQRDKLLYAHKWNFAIKRAVLIESTSDPVYEYTDQFELPSDYLRVIEIENKDVDEWKIEADKLVINRGSANINSNSEKLLNPSATTGSITLGAEDSSGSDISFFSSGDVGKYYQMTIGGTVGMVKITAYTDVSTVTATVTTTLGGTTATATWRESAAVKIRYIAQITDTTAFTNTFDEALAYMLAAEFAYPLVQSRNLANDMRDLAKAELKDIRSFDAQEGTPDSNNVDAWTGARGNGIINDRFRNFQ